MIWLYLRYSSLVGSIINPVTNYQHTNLISSMNSSNISGNLPEKKIRQLQSFLTHTKFSQDHINKIESPHEFMGKNPHYVNSANSSSKSEFTLFISVITVHILTTAFQVRKLLEIFPGSTKNCLPKVH